MGNSRRARPESTLISARLLRALLLVPALVTTGASAGLAAGGSGAARPPLIRIGVVPEAPEVRLRAAQAWSLGIVASGLRPTAIPPGEEWTLAADDRGVTVLDGSGRNRGSTRDTLYAYSQGAGVLEIDGTPYRGQMLVWNAGGRLTGVNVVDLESYLLSVLPAEMGPQKEARREALKAQAVAARSYTLAMVGRRGAKGYDLLSTVVDQVYGGVGGEKPTCSEAVAETRGVVAVHDGAPVLAYYSSTCGGHTASPGEVWNRPAAPYLRGVRDRAGRTEGSFCRISPYFRWVETWEGEELESILARTITRVRSDWDPKKMGHLTGISIQDRSPSQRVSRLSLRYQHGTVDLRGDDIRWVLRRPGGVDGLRSNLLIDVECRRSRGRVNGVRISGQGYGHGVGMCQFGAMGMAEAGYGYEQIIRFYYRGARLRRYF